uniref:Uncharacterized protein n=1 Tax=Rhizophora mucronata TaxID=61149 RepID=A0A2P2PUZ4_RHIMU
MKCTQVKMIKGNFTLGEQGGYIEISHKFFACPKPKYTQKKTKISYGFLPLSYMSLSSFSLVHGGLLFMVEILTRLVKKNGIPVHKAVTL